MQALFSMHPLVTPSPRHCTIPGVTKAREHFWDRLQLLLRESGKTATRVSSDLWGKTNRDKIRQIGVRAGTAPEASVHAKTLDELARYFNVSTKWLSHGGPERGVYSTHENELVLHATGIGVRREIAERVIAEHPDLGDPWVLVQVMIAEEAAARLGVQPKSSKKAR